jgi:HK97 family phage portal protein
VILSGGVLTKSPDAVVWRGTPATWNLQLSGFWSSYSGIYRKQLWVAVVVNKRARGTARLPLKTYVRGADDERQDARDHPYAALLRKPNPRLDSFGLWLWTSSTFDIYGEALWLKVRDRGGRPVELHPMHPTCVQSEMRDGRIVYEINTPTVTIHNIDESDMVHFKTYNPDDPCRGMSPLEPLRSTLENEDAARRATSGFWLRGARPGTALVHPGNLSQPAQDRLKLQFDSIAAGADKTGSTVVFEEGMKPEKLDLTAEEAQYIETRKLNREEVCGAYDVPPPVVHILDHATFSNITEQMRSMYRDTMAPHLKGFESTLESQLRGSVRQGATEPDFGDDVYSEFLLDEVLRGDFEVRMTAYQASVNSAISTPNEIRKLENRPPLPGGDQLFINSTMVPIAVAAEPLAPADVPAAPEDQPMADVIPIRTVMGRLSRQVSLDEVDVDALVDGLNGHSAAVRSAYWASKAANEDVAGLRARLKEMA